MTRTDANNLKPLHLVPFTCLGILCALLGAAWVDSRGGPVELEHELGHDMGGIDPDRVAAEPVTNGIAWTGLTELDERAGVLWEIGRRSDGVVCWRAVP